MLYLSIVLLCYVLIYNLEVSFNFHMTFLQLSVCVCVCVCVCVFSKGRYFQVGRYFRESIGR